MNGAPTAWQFGAMTCLCVQLGTIGIINTYLWHAEGVPGITGHPQHDGVTIAPPPAAWVQLAPSAASAHVDSRGRPGSTRQQQRNNKKRPFALDTQRGAI